MTNFICYNAIRFIFYKGGEGMFSILYRKLNSHDSDMEVENFINSAIEKSNPNEGFDNFEFSEEYLSVNFYKKLPSAEFLYNNRTENMIIENTKKKYISNLYYSKRNKIINITGTKNSSQILYEYLITFANFNLIPVKFDINTIYTAFNNFDYIIKKISYKDVNFLETKLPLLTLEFINNHDALNMIKKLNAIPSEIVLYLHLDNSGEATISFKLDNGEATLDMFNYSSLDYEILKQTLINIKE